MRFSPDDFGTAFIVARGLAVLHLSHKVILFESY